MCMACRACESICKHNAIVIKEDKEGNLDYRILDNKCVRCAECVNHYTAGCYMRKVLAIKRKQVEISEGIKIFKSVLNYSPKSVSVNTKKEIKFKLRAETGINTNTDIDIKINVD